MTELLAIATILGGIAAVWFFWDKMQRRGKQDTPLEDPTPTGSKDDAHSNIAQELRDLASRPAVNLPKGSRASSVNRGHTTRRDRSESEMPGACIIAASPFSPQCRQRCATSSPKLSRGSSNGFKSTSMANSRRSVLNVRRSVSRNFSAHLKRNKKVANKPDAGDGLQPRLIRNVRLMKSRILA